MEHIGAGGTAIAPDHAHKSQLMRRVRGLAGLAVLGAIPWSIGAVATIAVIKLGFIPGIDVFLASKAFSNLSVAAGLTGAVVGAVNGLLFGALVIVSERNQSLADVRYTRFAALGALATGSVMGLLSGSVGAAVVAGVLGGMSSAFTLWMARRAR